MKCPNCSSLMVEVKTPSAMVDKCYQCGGIWFDQGELKVFSNKLAQSDKIKPRQIKFFEKREVESVFSKKQKGKYCPRCHEEMELFNYMVDSNVFLDRCKKCGGLWTEKGEVKQVAEFIKQDPDTERLSLLFGQSVVEMSSATEIVDGSNLNIELSRMAGLSRPAICWSYRFIPIIVPYRIDLKRKNFPATTITLILICIGIFIARWMGLEIMAGEMIEIAFFAFDDTTWIKPFFSIGGVLYFPVLLLFLWLFGDNVEDSLGHLGLIVFAGMAFVAAWLLSAVTGWANTGAMTAMSGVISAVMGAFFIFHPTSKMMIFFWGKTQEVPAAVFLTIWFTVQFVLPWLTELNRADIAYWIANVAGFLIGMAVAAMVKSNRTEY